MRALSDNPALAMRALPYAVWFLLIVMPVAFAPKFFAACIARVPQPQPMSSTSSPGRNMSLRHTRFILLSCACSSDSCSSWKIALV
jgi:hypothetical protein